MVNKFDGHTKNQFITPADVADPEIWPTIPGPFVMVRPIGTPTTISHGSLTLHMPDQVQDDAKFLTNVGQVKVVGRMAYEESKEDENRFGYSKWCKEGDFVFWRKHAGNKLVYKGVIFNFLHDDEILGVIEDPEDISVYQNLVKY